MKPIGISMSLSRDGALRMGVTQPDRATDAIWLAVEEAIDAGWTPQQFRIEAAEAWGHTLRERAQAAEKALVSP